MDKPLNQCFVLDNNKWAYVDQLSKDCKKIYIIYSNLKRDKVNLKDVIYYSQVAPPSIPEDKNTELETLNAHDWSY